MLRLQLIRSSTTNLGACLADRNAWGPLMQPERVCSCESHSYALMGPLPAVRSAFSPQRPLLHPCLYTMHTANSALQRVPATAEGLFLLKTQPPGIWKRAAACFQCAAPHLMQQPALICMHSRDTALWSGVPAVSHCSHTSGRYARQSVFTSPSVSSHLEPIVPHPSCWCT